jgi:hypothetical protein
VEANRALAGTILGVTVAFGGIVGATPAFAQIGGDLPVNQQETSGGQCRDIRTGYETPCGSQLPTPVQKCSFTGAAAVIFGGVFGGPGGAGIAAIGAAANCLAETY